MKRKLKTSPSRSSKSTNPRRSSSLAPPPGGEFGPDSDLDFFVVKDDPQDLHDRIVTLYRLVEKDLPADFLVYTPEELQKRLALGDPFIRSIIEGGRVLYG